MGTVKAVVIAKTNNIELKSIKEPKVKSEEDVLLEVKVSGLCGTDIHIYEGDFFATYPVIPGHEFTGIVIDKGEKVKNIDKGDKVIVQPNINCGICEFCRSEKQHLCVSLEAYGVTRPGGFEEYAVVNYKNLFKFEAISFSEAAFAEPLGCVINGVSKIKKNLLATKSLIIGGGTIGLLMAQVIRLKGSEVYVVDRLDERVALARQLGFIAYNWVEFEQKNLGNYFDNVMECAGDYAALEYGIKYLKKGGTFLIFGVSPKDKFTTVNPYYLYKNEIQIVGSFSLSDTHMQTAIKLLETKRIVVEPLISEVIKIDDLPEKIRSKKTRGKVQVQF